jgi:hypothetical protein
MFHKSSSSKRTQTVDDNLHHTNGHFNPQYKAQSTSQLLSPNSIIVQSIALKSDQSTPNSSTLSLATGNGTNTNMPSPSNRRTIISQSTEDRFIMTLIKSPVDNSPRISSHDLVATTPVNEELPVNNKFFKSKVTAAFNHMKYRKLISRHQSYSTMESIVSQGWAVRMRPNFRTNESPIYFLGKLYNGKEGKVIDSIVDI